MMRLPAIALLFAVLVIVSCKKGDPAYPENNCSLKIENIDPSYIDAVWLHITNLENDNSNPERDIVYPSRKSTDSLFAVLKAIENLNLPETDTIFRKYYIHTNRGAGMQKVLLTMYDTSKITSDYNLSNLIKEYNLYPTFYRAFLSEFQIGLLSCQILNPFALKRKLKTAGYECDLLLPANDMFEEITIRKNPFTNTNIVTYHLHWGDCPAGCVYSRHWEYIVDAGNKARFVKSWGDIAH